MAEVEVVSPKGRWFVIVDREWNPSLIIGPYESRERAFWALNKSPFIDGLAEEDSLEIMAIQLEMDDGRLDYITPPEETDS